MSSRFGYRPGPPRDGRRAGAVLLSYRRQPNIDPILRSLLRGSLFERVVMSNNNPQASSRDFVTVSDERLVVIDQLERQGCGLRWHLAQELLADLDVIVVIDDDLFLYPRQLERLVAHALQAPDAPHGVVGGVGRRPVERREAEVEVLWRCYVVTPTHVDRYLDLVAALDPTMRDEVEQRGDDIAISLTGDEPPRVHDVGRLLSCATSDDADIAVYLQPEFQATRGQVRSAAEAARSTLGWASSTRLARGGGIEPPTS